MFSDEDRENTSGGIGFDSRRLHFNTCEMIEKNDQESDSQAVGARLVPKRSRPRWKFERDEERARMDAARTRRDVCPCGQRHTDMPEFSSWRHMVRRCTVPSDDAFPLYGGRGITVCERWRLSFHNFVEDMGPRPLGTSVERLNNDRGYEPGNCTWGTPTVQARNSRNTRLTASAAAEARQMLSDGCSTQDVADFFSVSKSCIKRLGRGETWR